MTPATFRSRPSHRPYTKRGISRVPCCACGAPSVHQWSVCALGNRWVPVCADCDMTINAWALTFMRVPNRVRLLQRYAARMGD